MVVAIAAYNLDHLLDRTHAQPLPDRRSIGAKLDGLTISSIAEEDSPAREARLRVGDEIVAVDGKEVAHWYALRRAVTSGDTKKTLTIERRGKKKDVVLDLADLQAKAKVEQRDRERLETFGPDALKVPEDLDERTRQMFGRDESCAAP